MFFVETLYFFAAYDIFVMAALFVFVWIFGAVNWCKNPYRKQNKKFDFCRNKIVANPKFTWLHISIVTEEYCRQWRAYVNSGAKRPSLVFEFVPKRNKLILLPAFVWCALASSCYVVLFCLDTSHREYIVFQVAFWLAFALVMVINKFTFAKKEKHARQTFGKFVCQLNAVSDIVQNDGAEKLIKRISEIKRTETGKTALEKASALLRENGLEGARTVEQQREINNALNGLLQAYSRKASLGAGI